MKLKMTINKLKCIDNLSIELPLISGLYAITGENGSGKSTIVTCASSAFFMMQMKDHFGKTDDDARIEFELNGNKRIYAKRKDEKNKVKWYNRVYGNFKVNGFYEGSLIYGNRFRNTTVEILRKIGNKKIELLAQADDFIRDNLGLILQGNKDYYTNLSIFNDDKLKAPVFFYERNGKLISQFYMSTGENLLISILYSLNNRIKSSKSSRTCQLILLDEIELALHPSSLRRLVAFLERIAKDNNFAIYFSTHSLEIIGAINPQNIFFVRHHIDNTYEIVNPCYPAYATKILYDHDGYDRILLVEDDLAKLILQTVLRKEKLLGNKLVHILPCGGYSNVINLAYEVVKFNLLTKKASVSMILDGDIKDKAKNYIKKRGENFNVPMNFLPLESLEKYLKENLIERVNHKLHSAMNDYLFHKRSLDEVLREYVSEMQKDDDGKKLFSMIEKELSNCNLSRNDLVDIVLNHIFENDNQRIKEITDFLAKELNG